MMMNMWRGEFEDYLFFLGCIIKVSRAIIVLDVHSMCLPMMLEGLEYGISGASDASYLVIFVDLACMICVS